MRTLRTIIPMGLALCLVSLAWAKDELIPTQPKSKERDAPPNPLRDVAGDMHTAGRLLQDAKTGDTTQEIEKSIIDKLEILIDAARQQQEQQSKGGQGEAKQRQEQKPQPKPDDAEKRKKDEEEARKKQLEKMKMQKEVKKPSDRPGMGKAGSGEATGPLQTDAEEWGKLPPAIRDQLLQTQGEGFPLKYRELLRRYYRMLSKQKE
jgi:hypothetical protein